VFRLLLNPNSKKGISVPVSTYATTPLYIHNRRDVPAFHLAGHPYTSITS
jgi:hypothetical protein